MDNTISTEDAALQLGCSSSWIRKLCRVHGIGQKLNPSHKHSAWVLTENEIQFLQGKLKRIVLQRDPREVRI